MGIYVQVKFKMLFKRIFRQYWYNLKPYMPLNHKKVN